tara:strand:- start:340 stop:498 length:159 start_codon:yes stop_codon:yes gene_type:complete
MKDSTKDILAAIASIAAIFALFKGAKASGRKRGQTTYTTKKGQLGRPFERKD